MFANRQISGSGLSHIWMMKKRFKYKADLGQSSCMYVLWGNTSFSNFLTVSLLLVVKTVVFSVTSGDCYIIAYLQRNYFLIVSCRTVGKMSRQLLLENKWLGTILPRIPVPIAREIEQKIKEQTKPLPTPQG